MLTVAAPAAEWQLLITRSPLTIPDGLGRAVDECADVADRQKNAHIPDGIPILVSGHGEVDEVLVHYFNNSPAFRSLARDSWLAYGREIATWCGFLGECDKTWLDASEIDFVAFKTRRTDRALYPDAVSGSTWNKAVYALRHLYDWAVNRRIIDANPVPPDKAASRVPGVRAEATSARSMRDRWLVPGTYRLWRDVGVGGRVVEQRGQTWWQAGAESSGFRGRNVVRNMAFTDLVYATGLRLKEAGALLVPEVDAAGHVERWLASRTAKYSKGRVWYFTPAAQRALSGYIKVTRRHAIARANREGRYDAIADIVWVKDVSRQTRRNRLELVLQDGGTRDLNHLDAAYRRRLFWMRDGRPEPMALWLGDSGMPLKHASWDDIFTSANERLADQIESKGGGFGDHLTVTPHSLRFSFALALLVGLHQQLDGAYGWDERMPYEDGHRYEQAYETVQNVLGHRSVETTKERYLPRVQRLRFDKVFADLGRFTSTTDVLSALAQDLVEVRDLTGASTDG